MSATTPPTTVSTRLGIHYWKCDRPAAFHGTTGSSAGDAAMIAELDRALRGRFFGCAPEVRPAGGQGNHRTFLAELPDGPAFVRVEDGPEHDDYFDVEGIILRMVREKGVPAPRQFAADTTRTETPFAWQALERVSGRDLNQHFKAGPLAHERIAAEIGALIARWQSIRPAGFGPFLAATARDWSALDGLHEDYASYFRLNLDRHLQFLGERSFLPPRQIARILATINEHQDLLRLETGCLVHKDLALWNILGSPETIAAVIDWDDSISGDPMDDLSLLGCFHGGDVIREALAGYAGIRPLPAGYRRRFWIHLLRNMLVKSVIRVGAGYFDRTSSFFLIGSGSSGQDLREFTLARIETALRGLEEEKDPCAL